MQYLPLSTTHYIMWEENVVFASVRHPLYHVEEKPGLAARKLFNLCSTEAM